jgi:hypothetical protein
LDTSKQGGNLMRVEYAYCYYLLKVQRINEHSTTDMKNQTWKF